MKKILIIDEDHKSLCYLADAAKFTFIDSDIIQSSCLTSIDKLLKLSLYHLILIGINSNNQNKMLYFSKIRSQQPNAMIVAVSAYEQLNDILSTLRLGADGYILKTESYTNLINILRNSESGIPPMSPMVTRKIILSFRQIKPVQYIKKLTQRENEVLVQLSKGLSNKGIANELGISAYTVADHVKSLFTKLKVKNRAETIAFAISNHDADNIYHVN